MRRERAFLHQLRVLRDSGDAIAGQEEWRVEGAHTVGFDGSRFGVVDDAIADVELDSAIDADVPLDAHFVCAGVVFRGVAVNVGIADVNGDIVARGRDPVLVVSPAAGRDLEGLPLQR